MGTQETLVASQPLLGVVRSSFTSVGKQIATLFLGAVAFSVAIAWNSWVQSLIVLWTPKDEGKKKSAVVSFNLWVSFGLTIVAVLLSWGLTKIYGKSIVDGQASSYGLAS